MPTELSAMGRVSQLVDYLEQAILDGDLSPGDKLPSERVLCAQLGVSRGVVREALVQLARDELVCRRHGSGTRVAAPTARPVQIGLRRLLRVGSFEWRDLGAARLSLQLPAVRLAALRRSSDHLCGLEQWRVALGDTSLSTDERLHAYVSFHRKLATAGGNLVYDILLAPILDETIHALSQRPTTDCGMCDLQAHDELSAAVVGRDVRGAEQAIRRHIVHLHRRQPARNARRVQLVKA